VVVVEIFDPFIDSEGNMEHYLHKTTPSIQESQAELCWLCYGSDLSIVISMGITLKFLSSRYILTILSC
jgi:hypothetical protein